MTKRPSNSSLPQWPDSIRPLRKAIGMLTLLLVSVNMPFDSVAKGLDEHELRALFLFNFASFVRWPEEVFDSPSSPLRYCAVGKGLVNRPLRGLLQGESLKDHPLDFQEVSGDAIPDGCHLVYINKAEVSTTASIVSQLAGKATLIVTENQETLGSGAMVALERQGTRIRPVVNLDAAEQSGLKLSAKLLQLSTVVSAR